MRPIIQPGDIVVCIDSLQRPDDGPNNLVAGATYRVMDMAVCGCGRASVDVGHFTESHGAYCLLCGDQLRGCCFRASRFIKLPPPREIAERELAEMMERN